MQTRGKGLQFQSLQIPKMYRMLCGCFSQDAGSRMANQKHNNTLVCPEVQVESEYRVGPGKKKSTPGKTI